MRDSRPVVAVALILIAAACSSYKSPGYNPPAKPPPYGYSVPDPADPSVLRVDVTDFRFVPESLEVHAGDTVRWENHGAVVHTTTSGEKGTPDGTWDATLNPGASIERAFPSPGVYHYFCTPHQAMGMKGVIVVKAR